MTFTVAYREKSGAKAEVEIEAANRAACMAECRARGIAPMGIREGRSGKSAASSTVQGQPKERAKRKLFTIYFYLFVAIAVIAAIAWWLARPQAKPPVDPPKNAKPVREAKPKPQPKPVAKPAAPKPASRPAKPVAEKPVPSPTNEVRYYNGQPVVRVEATTNSAGLLVERLFTADGKKHRLTHFPPPVFKHASDEYLATILSTPPGAQMPPLPDLSGENMEAQFMKSLEDEIDIAQNEPNHIKDIKLKVLMARENMKELIKEGRSFADVLEETRRTMNENVEIRAQAMKQYREFLSKGHEEEAEDLRIKMNEVLVQMGIEEIQPRKRRTENQ